MPEPQTLINYKGALSFGIISQLLNELKEKMDLLGEKLSTYKRILIIMVEVLENINKYIESQQNSGNSTHPNEIDFKLSKAESTYFIKSSNLIRIDAQKIIEEKINVVNNMNHDELKKFYRLIISNGQFSKEGGAGLGFIEIAKTSQNKINYSFEKTNNELVYYTINLELTS